MNEQIAIGLAGRRSTAGLRAVLLKQAREDAGMSLAEVGQPVEDA